MKYPQLVSPRAVNAISDWLVSRLEQLGVESPQIYTRLLLSLLQSSVQVNDPIEFSNLEAFFANRKGGHKRFYLPSDTETLKKLNAVQCLREIVSNEQEITAIEQLVDELCEKLKDIEKQIQDFNGEENFLVETRDHPYSLTHAQIKSQIPQHQESGSHKQQHHTRHHHNQLHQIEHICSYTNNSVFDNSNDSKGNHAFQAISTTCALNDVDNDPKNRYFRAFPALSKEMEDSFRIWRRNVKSLTWPVVGRSIVVDCNNSKNSLTSLISNGTSSTDKCVEKKLKREGGENQLGNRVNAAIAVKFSASDSGIGSNAGVSDIQQQQGAVTTAASAKKKFKRRRNQVFCKGKTVQNIRKLSVGPTSNSVGSNNKYHHYTHHHNSSPAWDTDFTGCWEMGPDLIKEFLTRQNGNKRSRSNSDNMDQENQNERKFLNEDPVENEKPVIKQYIDLSFCFDDDEDGEESQHQYTDESIGYIDEDYDDNTLASISELSMDNVNPKRLYQREGRLQKSQTCSVLIENIDGDNIIDEAADFIDPVDFQQFKAKFNSSVEALWKGVESTSNGGSQQPTAHTVAENSLKMNFLGSGCSNISSAFYATTSLNALAPFKKDLWNFWSNYDQQANKLSTTTSTSSIITTRLNDSSASSGIGADIANSSDYFSMPSNLNDFEKSVGSVRRANETDASLGVHTPSINVFLQNSIWSTSGDYVDTIGTSSAADTDENFLFKVWHSNKKLSQLDVGNVISGEKLSTLVTDMDGEDENSFRNSRESLRINNISVLGANLNFSPYHNLKWSEGINAGPPCHNLRKQINASLIEVESSGRTSLRNDNTLVNLNSATNFSGATWEAPVYGRNAQPDLKSWCASNPISLNEMYGNDVCDSIVNQSSLEEQEKTSISTATSPAVTLPNHCANTSGFVAYARIKECGILQLQTKPLQTLNSSRLPKDHFKSNEDENLLTSERTHFHPIENFVDGHTFEICNTLDTVEFERTASGLMRYESEEYLEYTRSDIYMADEEVATNATNLLKFNKRVNGEKNKSFVIKFRLKRSGEIACQTEEKEFQLAATKLVEQPTISTLNGTTHPPPPIEMSNMFHNTFSVSRQANNEAIIAAVTKAVAAAAKAAAENHLNSSHFPWLSPTSSTNTCTMGNSRLWIASETSLCDEVEFCKGENLNPQNNTTFTTTGVNVHYHGQLTQNWSMQEVEKQCHQRRCAPQQNQQQRHQQQQQQLDIKNEIHSSVDIERNEENSLDNTSLHTLWGMCAACNSCEYSKSMPANRLLRDELELEGDEIMSDLRYMQDLYIGESDILTETFEASLEELDIESSDRKNCVMDKELNDQSTKNPWNLDNEHIQISVLQKVIEDLLKPENSRRIPRTLNYNHMELNNDAKLNQNLAKTQNLWQFEEKEENNIWQHKPIIEGCKGESSIQVESLIKPMKLLKQVGGALTESPQYRKTLNWEHENLAKIWQQTTTPNLTQMEEKLIVSRQNEGNNNVINDKALKKKQETWEISQQQLVEENNLKNTQNISPRTTLLPSATICKKVQQFLNNSTAKIKLAANRKRRHSASQNFYQQQHLQYSSNSNKKNYNNNDGITDLNIYKQILDATVKGAKEEQQHQEVAPHIGTTEEQPPKQTIITCKYWTTSTNGTQSSLDSAAAAMMILAAATNVNTNDMMTSVNTDTIYNLEDAMLEENIFGNTFSCLIDKNASILKHMTMMTRPLTR